MEQRRSDGAEQRADDGGASEVPSSREARRNSGPSGETEPGHAIRDVVVSAQSEITRNRGQGDLLRNLAPVEPVDFLVNVGQQSVVEQPGVRRVEVSEREGGEIGNPGALAAPVQINQPLAPPQGRPMVYGPPGMYPPMMPQQFFHQGHFEYPQRVFPQPAGTGMPVTDPTWFGTPVRPIEVNAPVGNPFWSPDARRALGWGGEENRSVDPRRMYGNQVDEGNQMGRPVAMSQERVEMLNEGGRESGVPVTLGREVPRDGADPGGQQNGVGSSVTPQIEAAGVVMDPIELFRLRCMREAEQKFAEGLERMRHETQQGPDGGSGSYVSLPNQNTPPGLNGNGNGNAENPPNTGIGSDRRNGMGAEAASETLRSLELPKLAENASTLNFGDWLAVVEPLMADLGTNSSEWWSIIMGHVQKTYETWLTESPLGRLRLTIDIPEAAKGWPRTEKRAVTMLLQSLHEKLRTEMVSSRRLTTPQIMFRLFCIYQPGGQAERSSLLQLLTEFRLGSGVQEHAGALRKWVRWLERGEELGIVLPDPMILSGVLGRASDVVSKSSGQVGFRLASARQQLQLDNRPKLQDVKLFAEYVLAEAEELVISGPQNGNPQGIGGSGNSQKPSVKWLNAGENVGVSGQGSKEPPKENGHDGRGLLPGNASNVSSKTPCRFWMSDDGCKKGEKCRYTHTVLDPKDNRCFSCSALGHGKRDCPNKKKIAKTQTEKGQKGGGKGNRADLEKNPQRSGSGGSENPSGEKPAETQNEKPEPPSSQTEGLDALLQEASTLMKALRPSLKVVMVKNPSCCKTATAENSTGLLDGGATNALRFGSPLEIKEANLVTVELASGTTQLYQHPLTGTLLSSVPVEPIVPLRGLVSLGFKIQWDKRGFVVHHPVHGKLACWLRNGCPVVKEKHALQLIHDIEQSELRKTNGPRVAAESVSGDVVNWWKQHFPEVPEGVVNYMVGQHEGIPDGSKLPWNRHARRRFEKSKALVIHLFSGENPKFWKTGWPQGVEVLTLDNKVDPQQDLHDPAVWSYLVHLVKTKPILGIIGGPPCRSVSRLRHVSPGPRPVRGRGKDRFGLVGLSRKERALVEGDGALMLKQLALVELAKENEENRNQHVGFLMESPEDPCAYDPKAETENYPSFWEWTEVEEFGKRHDMELCSFDQGCFGHPQTKPTSCLVNLQEVKVVNGSRVVGKRGMELKKDLKERFEQTASWSEWAPGLKELIKGSIGTLVEKRGLGRVKVKRVLDYEGWKTHITQGHRPYRRDCRACILDMANGPPHRRKTSNGSSSWSMGVDVVQMVPSKDRVSGSDVKYAVVATALVPVFETLEDPKEPDLVPEEIELPNWGEGLDEQDFPLGDPNEEIGDSPVNHPLPGIDEGLEMLGEDLRLGEEKGENQEKRDHEQTKPQVASGPEEKGQNPKDDFLRGVAETCAGPLKLRHVTLVETVGSRQTSEILNALSILLVKFRSMGICVNRLHGDRAKELLSSKLKAWCARNNLLFTLGGGDDPANNGHVESEIGQLKRRLRLTLRQAGQKPESWPQALRWVAEQRMRDQLSTFGVKNPQWSPTTLRC